MEKQAITSIEGADGATIAPFAALQSRLDRTASRLRLLYLAHIGGWALLGLSGLVALVSLVARVLHRPLLPRLVFGACAVAVAALVLAIIWSFRPRATLRFRREAARRIDDAAQLGSALRVALELADAVPRSPFWAPHVSRTIDRLAQSRLRPDDPVVPWRAPTALLAAIGIFALALLLPKLPHHSMSSVAPKDLPLAAPEVALDPIDRARLKSSAAELSTAAAQMKDATTAAHEKELSELANQIADERIGHAEAFAKLNQLETQLDPAKQGVAEKLLVDLRAKGAAAAKEKVTEKLAAALKDEDLDKAKEELQKLAAAAEARDAEKKAGGEDAGASPEAQPQQKDQLTPQERAQLARALDKMNESQRERKVQAQKEQKQIDELKQEQRRLQKQIAEKPKDEELKRKLQRNQRELEKLEREQQERQEAERQLERLEREMNQAAEQLRSKMSPEALQKAAEQMSQMQNEIRKLMAQGKLQMQIMELREVLRRSGVRQGGQGEKNAQKSPNGKGKGKGTRELLDDFNKRAGDKDQMFTLGGDGKPGMMLPLPAPQKPGDSGGGQGKEKPGDGIGSETDPNLLGDKTKIDSRRIASRTQGKEGEGESRSQTIITSAQHGFASTAYRRAYGDYSSLAEEAMTKEEIPPGYRYYVKRYFELIKPR